MALKMDSGEVRVSGEGLGPGSEFDRQAGVLVELGYPAAAGLGAEEFRALAAPLRAVAEARGGGERSLGAGRVPFLLVVTRQVVPIERTMELTTMHGKKKPGFVDRSFEPGALERFVPVKEAPLPRQGAYLLLDVERGEEFCGAVPSDAMAVIAERGRTPLTVEEGVALLTQFPQTLVKNKCFSLGGSRCGDRRVPALWISGGAPKLGWCWEGNPHTWLGMASAGGRRAE